MTPNRSSPIYLDHHATTPIAPEVVDAMMPLLTTEFGNPGSHHGYGWAAESAVKAARATIAQAIHAQPEEIIFTSGATESNNLAIKGIAEAYLRQGKHLITIATEHRAVLEPCRYLASFGFELTILPVDANGLLSVDRLAAAIRPDTILVSVMMANNEIGTIQPIAEIGKLCHDRGVIFHTDAAQALGKIPIDVQAMQIDLMSITAHKLYGPKGIGALYVRRRNPRVTIAPQIHGGGQERDLRSGTLAPAQIVGFAKAVSLAMTDLETEASRLAQLRDRLLDQLQLKLGSDRVQVHGSRSQRLPSNLNLSLLDDCGNPIESGRLMNHLRDQLAISSGSTCANANNKLSHVLQAIGQSDHLSRAALRFGLGRATTVESIDRAVEIIIAAVNRATER